MNSEPGEGIGPYIKRLRERAGVSQVELARGAKMSRAYLSQLEEKKEAVPAPDLRRRIAQHLGTTNVALLIAAGQIHPSEIESGASAPLLFPPQDPRADVVQLLQELNSDDAESAADYLRFLLTKRGEVVPMD